MGPLAIEVRGGNALQQARNVLLSSSSEELVACFGRVASSPDRGIFLVQDVQIAPEQYLTRGPDGLRWSPELTRLWSNRAEDDQQGVLLLHAHPVRGMVRLSNTDRQTCERMLSHFGRLVPNQMHGYGVVGVEAVTGECVYAGQHGAIRWLKTVGCPIRKWSDSPLAMPAPPPAMARQVAAITATGQARLKGALVGLVGLGGAGSTVADQLGHKGVGFLILCDGDRMKHVNLSRQTGAGPSDIGSYKIDIAARGIRHANPDVELSLVHDHFPDPVSMQQLKNVDIIVSCVDSALARHEVNQFGRRYLIPVVDVGATIRTKDGQIELIAGHAMRALPDGECLECAGLTTPALRAAERAAERQGRYLNDPDAQGAPQVMSINGLLASLAATEVLRLIAGLSEDAHSRHWRYEALAGEVYALEPKARHCDVCNVLGMGDAER